MASAFPVAIEQRKPLVFPRELELARLAHAAAPQSAAARGRLAGLLVRSDRFDEALALYEAAGPSSFDDAMNLIHALMAFETRAGNERVCAMAERALALAEHDEERAAALAACGKAQLRLQRAEGVATLETALSLDPHNPDACKRLVAHHLANGDADAVLALVDRLQGAGVAHSRALTARALAQTQRGDIAAARATVGLDRFLYRETLPAPAGWPDIATLNAALAAQLLDHPALRYERYGTASAYSWRVDDPLSQAAPLVEVLLNEVRAAVARHLATIGQHDHPWLAARPPGGTLHSWSVIAEGGGFETWHVHQFGWLSGVYYVQVPDAIRTGSDQGGCLALGMPEDVVGAEAAAAYGLTQVRPEPGLLLLFPSHAYHRTFPHGAAERRIVLAFDIWPA